MKLSDLMLNKVNAQLADIIHSVKSFGAKGDGVKDDSVAFQNAINEVSALGGGTVWIPYATYLLNSPITVKNGVTLKSCGGARGSGGAILKAGASNIGQMFTDQSGASTAFIGLNFQGYTTADSVPTINAIYINANSKIESCGFNFFAQSAIVLSGTSIACTISDVGGQNLVYDRTVSVKTGAAHVLGTDHYLFNVEMNVQSGHIDVTVNQNAVAVLIGGDNNFISDSIGEFGEIGIYVSGNKNRFNGCRADRNMGHGFIITGQQNIFVNCLSLENGTALANTYDGFQITSTLNLFLGCSYGLQGTSTVRYGFNDTVQSATQKSEYIGCSVVGATGTAKFNNNVALGSGFIFGNGWYKFTNNETTVDVSGKNLINLEYSTSTTITNFIGGVDGQQIKILAVNVTLQYNSNIKTNTGADKSLNPGPGYNKIYTFTQYSGVWYENE